MWIEIDQEDAEHLSTALNLAFSSMFKFAAQHPLKRRNRNLLHRIARTKEMQNPLESIKTLDLVKILPAAQLKIKTVVGIAGLNSIILELNYKDSLHLIDTLKKEALKTDDNERIAVLDSDQS
jgi:hypothetical protein